MQFLDRADGGRQLVSRLEQYRDDPNAVVIGLPRGGVVTASEVAKGLHLPLDVICPRKIGAPMNPEFAIGAITETGEGIFHEDAIEEYGISEQYLDQKVKEEKEIANQRLNLYRHQRPPRNLKKKKVIIVDDGLATGATMQAAVISVKKEGALEVIVAVPVSPRTTLSKFTKKVDQIVCLMTPPGFYAVGQFYDDFTPVDDEEVMRVLSSF